MLPIHLPFAQTLATVRRGVAAITGPINAGVCWLDRQITYYCDTYLPHPINVVAKAFIKALPFIVLQSVLPTPAFIAVVIGVAVYAWAVTRSAAREGRPSDFPNLPKIFQHGAVFRSFALAVVNAATFAMTGQVVFLVFAVAFGLTGVAVALHSHLVKDIVTPPPSFVPVEQFGS